MSDDSASAAASPSRVAPVRRPIARCLTGCRPLRGGLPLGLPSAGLGRSFTGVLSVTAAARLVTVSALIAAGTGPLPSATVPAPPSWPWRRAALFLAGAAQLITISALVGVDPPPVTWSSVLLAIAPAPLAAVAAFAPAPVNRLAVVVGVAGPGRGYCGGVASYWPVFRPGAGGPVCRWHDRWDVGQAGLPEEVELRASGNGPYYGRFMMKPRPGSKPSLQARLVAVSLADQVGRAFSADEAARSALTNRPDGAAPLPQRTARLSAASGGAAIVEAAWRRAHPRCGDLPG